MKWHVLRPLWVVLGVVGVVLVARFFLVPSDFGVHGKSFTYGFYRLSNVQEWKDFPVKYQGSDYCALCHPENSESISTSPHQRIECENCHGPGVDHPGIVSALPANTSRGHCLRCHADLEYANSSRAALPGINPDEHMLQFECSECHNPHDPQEGT